MTEVATPPRERVEEHKNGHANGMIPVAERIEHHHRQPAPDARAQVPEPFPPILWRGLGWGMLGGLLLGLLFAWLLRSGTIVISGWEGVFSLVPITFYTFWAMMGAALGLLVGGIGTILTAKAERHG
jgi:hypothetical protein